MIDINALPWVTAVTGGDRDRLRTATASEVGRCDVRGCAYPAAVCSLTDTGYPLDWYCAAHAATLCATEHPRMQPRDRCVGCGGLA